MTKMIDSPWQERSQFYENPLSKFAAPAFWLDMLRYPTNEYFEWRVMRVGAELQQDDIICVDTDDILRMSGMDEANQIAFLQDKSKLHFDNLRRKLGLG